MWECVCERESLLYSQAQRNILLVNVYFWEIIFNGIAKIVLFQSNKNNVHYRFICTYRLYISIWHLFSFNLVLPLDFFTSGSGSASLMNWPSSFTFPKVILLKGSATDLHPRETPPEPTSVLVIVLRWIGLKCNTNADSPSVWSLVERFWIKTGDVHRYRLIEVLQDLDRSFFSTLLQIGVKTIVF